MSNEPDEFVRVYRIVPSCIDCKRDVGAGVGAIGVRKTTLILDRIKVDQIIVEGRFRKDLGSIKALAQSIEQVGLLRPLVVSPDYNLHDGQRQLEAVKLLGWSDVPVIVVDLDDVVLGQYHTNAFTKPYLLSEAVAIKKALDRKLAVPRGRPSKKKVGNAHLSGSRKKRDIVARFTTYSARTLKRAEAVVDAAEREPGKYAPLVAEMDESKSAHGAYRKLAAAVKKEQIDREPPPLAKGPFRNIIVDAPWRYPRDKDPKFDFSPHYPTMTIEEITGLPVLQLAHKNCILWMWTPIPFLKNALTIVEGWGFTIKTVVTWDKERIGYGDWLKSQTEHCIMAVRGKPSVNLTNQSTIIRERAREHSRKPDAFYKLVESLCPGSKLEMFARTKRPGWTAYGNETEFFRPEAPDAKPIENSPLSRQFSSVLRSLTN